MRDYYSPPTPSSLCPPPPTPPPPLRPCLFFCFALPRYDNQLFDVPAPKNAVEFKERMADLTKTGEPFEES